MEWFNPIEWLSWVYGRVFQGHTWGKWVGGVLVVVMFAIGGLVLWMRAIDKYEEEHDSPKSQAATTNSPSPQTSAAPLTQAAIPLQNPPVKASKPNHEKSPGPRDDLIPVASCPPGTNQVVVDQSEISDNSVSCVIRVANPCIVIKGHSYIERNTGGAICSSTPTQTQQPTQIIKGSGNTSVGQLTQGSGSIAQIGGSGNTATINPSVNYIEPDKAIKTKLNDAFDDLRAKYVGREIIVRVKVVSGNSQGQKVGELIGSILRPRNLGFYFDPTNIFMGGPPNGAPITIICTVNDVPLANDIALAMSSYFSRPPFIDPSGGKDGRLDLYIYGEPTFRADGFVEFK